MSWPPAPPPSLLALELAPPAFQRFGDNREAGPPLAGEEPGRGGEEGPVGGAVPGPLPPPSEDPQLMAQYRDLQLPIIEARPDEQAKQAAQEAIQEEREHGRSLTGSPALRQRRMSAARSNMFTPPEIRGAPVSAGELAGHTT